jgi:hypothetical protein
MSSPTTAKLPPPKEEMDAIFGGSDDEKGELSDVPSDFEEDCNFEKAFLLYGTGD